MKLDGKSIDLDNPETWDYIPEGNIIQINEHILAQIGYAFCWMNYFHPNTIKNEQIDRIESLIKRFCEERSKNIENLHWFQEIMYLLEDEMENLI